MQTSCNATTGAFAFSVDLTSADRLIAIYLDGEPLSGGVTYTRNADTTSNITGIELIEDRVGIRSESATAVTAAAINGWDGSNDGDIPVNYASGTLDADPGTELHVVAGETFNGNANLQFDDYHVEAGATLLGPTGAGAYIDITGAGESSDCTLQIGLKTPMCLEPGSSVDFTAAELWYAPDQGAHPGNVAIPGTTSDVLTILPAGWTVHLGTSAGQTFTANRIGIDPCDAAGTAGGYVDLSRWAPDIVVTGDVSVPDDYCGLHGGAARGSITVGGSWSGSGFVDVPGYDVEFRPRTALTAFGKNGQWWWAGNGWRVGSLQVSSSAFVRDAAGAAGDGILPGYDTAGVDTPTMLYHHQDMPFVLGRDPGGAGRWMTYRTDFDGTLDWGPTFWDPTAGDDVPLVVEEMETTTWGWTMYVGGRIGQNGGDWAVRAYDPITGALRQPFGNWDDPADAGTQNDTYVIGHATGLDEVTSIVADRQWNGTAYVDRIVVMGTYFNGADSDIRVVRLNAGTGAVQSGPLTYDSGGTDTASRGCWMDQNSALVLGSVSANAGDVIARAVTLPTSGAIRWRGVGTDNSAFGTIDVDAPDGVPDLLQWGGATTTEQAVACDTDYRTSVIGANQTTAGDTDGVVQVIGWDGIVDSSWGSSGENRFDSGATGDLLMDVDIEHDHSRVLASGRFGTGSGVAAVTRWTGDGDIDTTLDDDGLLLLDTPGDDRAAGISIGWNEQHFDVLLQDGSGAGGAGISMQRRTFAGELLDGQPGTPVVEATGDRAAEERPWPLSITGNLLVGLPGDTTEAILQLDEFDPRTDVHGATSIGALGQIDLSSQVATTFRGDFDNASGGTFHAGSGTARFRPRSTASSISTGTPGGGIDAANTFSTLDLDLPASTPAAAHAVQLDPAFTTTVRDQLRASGASCAQPLRLRSSAAGVPAALDTTGAARTGSNIAVRDVTVTPAWNIAAGSLAGTTTGWTVTAPCGGAPPAEPDALFVDDTDAQPGSPNARDITSITPHLSLRNRAGTTVDRHRTQVWSDLVDASVRHLWQLDGATTDAGADALALTLGAAGQQPTWIAGKSGQALSFDGNDTASVANPALDSLTDLSVDMWIRMSSPDDGAVFVREDGTGNPPLYLYVTTGGTFYGGFYYGTGGSDWVETSATIDPATVFDGNWHHVALTIESSGSERTGTFYFDGERSQTFSTTRSPRSVPGAPLRLASEASGGTLDADLESVRVLDRAPSSDEIRGFAKAGRVHASLVWDSGDQPLGAIVADGARTPDIVYAGPADILADGARFYVTARLRTDAGAVPATTWSDWSTPDWFETASSASLTVSTPTQIALGSRFPGEDAVATSTLDVWTDAARGYTLSIQSRSNSFALSTGIDTIGRWNAASTTPSTWAAGTPGGFGVAVLAATGGKDTARWGTGTTSSDLANLKFVGPRRTVSILLHRRSTHSLATDQVDVAWRANAPLATAPGAYRGEMTFTAVANP